MNEKQLQVLIGKLATDDKLKEELLKIKDKDSMKKFINDYDKSIETDDDEAQALFEKLQDFLKRNGDDGDLSLSDLEAASGGWFFEPAAIRIYAGKDSYGKSYYRTFNQGAANQAGVFIERRLLGSNRYKYQGKYISKEQAYSIVYDYQKNDSPPGSVIIPQLTY